MEMSTQSISQLDALKAAIRNYKRKNWGELAKATKVSWSTINKIAYGDSTNPRLNTVKALEKHLGLDQ